MSDGADYRMVMPFESDAPEFAMGFEAGGIYACAMSLAPAFVSTIHAGNRAQMQRIAEATSRSVVFTFLNDDWLQTHFSERSDATPER